MRYVVCMAVICSICLVSVDALAQEVGENDFCAKVKKCTPVVTKKKRRRHHKKHKKVVPVVVKGVPGPVGETGPVGPRGPRGLPGRIVVLRNPAAKPQLTFALGYMAASFGGGWNYEYAHGPSLRVNAALDQKDTLLLELGYAPGRSGAVMTRISFTRWTQERSWLGLTLGAYAQFMGTYRGDRVDVFAVNPQLSARKTFGHFHFELGAGPAFGVARSPKYGTASVGGVAGSAGVNYVW